MLWGRRWWIGILGMLGKKFLVILIFLDFIIIGEVFSVKFIYSDLLIVREFLVCLLNLNLFVEF